MTLIEKKLHRYHALDAARGVAAFIVAIQHSYLIYWSKTDDYLETDAAKTQILSLCDVLSNISRSIVIFFFILSGFVMYKSLDDGSKFSSKFVSERLNRLYPAFALVAVMCFAAKTSGAVSLPAHISWWGGTQTWYENITYGSLIRHLFLFGTNESIRLNVCTWSLVHEFRIILIFPIVYWCVKLKPALSFIFSIFISYIFCSAGPLGSDRQDTSIAVSVGATIHYLFLFVTGCLLAKYITALNYIIVRRIHSKATLFVLSLAFIALLSFNFGPPFLWDYIALVGGTGLMIVALAYNGIFKGIYSTIGISFGAISYEFYLLHVPILLLMRQLQSESIGACSLVALSLSLTVVLSYSLKATINLLNRRATAICIYTFGERPTLSFKPGNSL